MDALAELQRLTTSSENAVIIRRAVDSFDVSHLLSQVSTKTLVMHAIVPQEPAWERFFRELKRFTC